VYIWYLYKYRRPVVCCEYAAIETIIESTGDARPPMLLRYFLRAHPTFAPCPISPRSSYEVPSDVRTHLRGLPNKYRGDPVCAKPTFFLGMWCGKSLSSNISRVKRRTPVKLFFQNTVWLLRYRSQSYALPLGSPKDPAGAARRMVLLVLHST